MALAQPQLDSRTYSCSICLEPLTEPVTSPCGHNFCCSCIQVNWDIEEEMRDSYSCPECRKHFAVRPNLAKNTMLAALVEDLKKGARPKVSGSCLNCEGQQLKDHTSTATKEPQRKNTCNYHDEAVQMHLSQDPSNACNLCLLMDHHSQKMELVWGERHQKIDLACQGIRQRIRSKAEDVELLQQTLQAANECADRAVANTEKIFDKMFHLLKKSRAKVWQQIRSVQYAKAGVLRERQLELEQEISELVRREAELTEMQQLKTEEPPVEEPLTVSTASDPVHQSSVSIRPSRRLKSDGPVTELTDVLQRHLVEKWSDIPWSVINVDVLLTKTDPESCRRTKKDERRTCC